METLIGREKEIDLLNKRIAEKDTEISRLKAENKKLKKVATTKVLSTINNL